MFWLLLSSTCTVLRFSLFSPFFLFPPANSLGVCKKLGGNKHSAADPSGPKGYCMSGNTMLSNRTEGRARFSKAAICSGTGQASVFLWEWQVPLFHFFFLFTLLIILSIAWPMNFFGFALTILSPHPAAGMVSEQLSCQLGQIHRSFAGEKKKSNKMQPQ